MAHDYNLQGIYVCVVIIFLLLLLKLIGVIL